MDPAPIMRAVVDDRIYIVQGVDTLPLCESFRWFTPHDSIKYFPLCDDFGPMNMESVLAFSKQLDAEISAHPCCRLFFRANEGARALTNAIFLLGTYMILMIESSPDHVRRMLLLAGATPASGVQRRDGLPA